MKNKTFWLFITLNLLLTVSDGILTYIGTPDLQYEANPLVSCFQLGWIALILSNLLWFFLYVFCTYYALVRYKSMYYQAHNLKEYLSFLAFNRPDKFIWTLYKLPKNWKPVLASGGFAFMLAFPAARLVIVAEWIMTLTNIRLAEAYYSFKEHLPFCRLDIPVTAAIVLFGMLFWFYREYKKNARHLKGSAQDV